MCGVWGPGVGEGPGTMFSALGALGARDARVALVALGTPLKPTKIQNSRIWDIPPEKLTSLRTPFNKFVIKLKER